MWGAASKSTGRSTVLPTKAGPSSRSCGINQPAQSMTHPGQRRVHKGSPTAWVSGDCESRTVPGSCPARGASQSGFILTKVLVAARDPRFEFDQRSRAACYTRRTRSQLSLTLVSDSKRPLRVWREINDLRRRSNRDLGTEIGLARRFVTRVAVFQ